MSPKLQKGDALGAFKIVKALGGGGNADVYEADSETGSRVALKVLRNRTRNSEPYRRFRQEVQQHYELSERGMEGVLPLLAFDVPEAPHRSRPAWMAMPIAEPIETALQTAPALERVAEAMAQIASTLARLHEEGIAHRDIKPTNLYMHEGSWVISDFGLVAIPDGEALTVGARALGPRHFIAPEMLLRPDAADGRPADVYSLGKTLWCLLAGQRIPPPGEHRRDLEWKGLAQWGVSHPRAFYLDRLIEHACAETPGMRPPMSVVSEALANWAHPVRHMSHSKNAVEARDVGAAIGDIFATDQHEAALRRQRETDLEHIVERLAECLTSLSDQLQGSVETRVTRDHNILSNALMGFADALPGKDRIAAWRSIGIYRNTGRDTRQAFLRSGVAAALATDQTVVVAAAHALRHRNGLETIWKDGSPRVLLGSRDLDSEVERIGDGFRRSVPQALARLLEVIRRPPGQLGEEARVSTRGWTT